MKYTFADFDTERGTDDSVDAYYRTTCRHCGATGPNVSNITDPVQKEFHELLSMVMHMPNCKLMKATNDALHVS